MPNIENLRKQAKQIVRWHREGHYPVAAVVREYLPRYRNLSDPEVLALSLKLTDAQEIVARREGFESWDALKNGAEPMQTEQKAQTTRATLTLAETQLYVADVTAACRYYESIMGFSTRFVYGEPPFYGQVVRDSIRLNLRCVEAGLIDHDRKAAEDLLSVTILTDDVKGLFLEFQEAGAVFHHTLHTEPWGARTFTVRDLDGNLLMFVGE
jgi:uncharacterized glyoxalase superfamily protein PhnB